jgi:chloramphenicol-sensitive protein RarD
MSPGTALVVFAYTFWGLQPLYWKQLGAIESQTVLAYRLLLTLLVIGFMVAWRGEFSKLAAHLRRDPRRILIALVSAGLIGSNWMLFVWAVGHGEIMQTGLGYFICPVLTLFCATLFLKERLRGVQYLGLLLVCLALAAKVIGSEGVPWIALGLAGSFSLYLTLRKAFPFDPVLEIFLEMCALAPLAIWLLSVTPQSALAAMATKDLLWLSLAGFVTALPMLSLVEGLRSVPLQKAAFIQYLTPSLSMVVGWILGESFSFQQGVELIIILLGVILAAFGDRLLGNPLLLGFRGSSQIADTHFLKKA